MRIEISYIFHNCFIVRMEQEALIFDYPAAQFLDEARRDIVRKLIQNTDLYVFASHNHPDHFNRQIDELGCGARRVSYILARDIMRKNRFLRERPDCLSAAPDQTYRIGRLEVKTFRSNDAGVAFLIQGYGLYIYFGGDLANWDWEGLTNHEHRVLVDYFGEVLLKLQQYPIQIGFSNADPRLVNWSGATQFIEAIKPRLFVPMHVLGEVQTLARFGAEHPGLPSRIFSYQKTGDSVSLEVTAGVKQN